MKVALIDLNESQEFIDALKADVIPIIIGPKDNFEILKTKIIALDKQITNIVIAQHFNDRALQIGSESEIIYADSSTWTNLKQFLIDMKKIGVETVDLLACLLYAQPGVPEMFSELEKETGVDLRASTDDTGNIEVGGNWILESDMVNIEELYFTEKIENFKDLFIQAIIGSGPGVNISNAPYYVGWWSSKTQMFVSAAELQATGMMPSFISALKFNVINKLSTLTQLSDFTIKMYETTSTNPLSASIMDDSLFTQVYSQNFTLPANHSTSQIYTHTFNQPFLWNGYSNLVIQTCYTNTQYNGAIIVEGTSGLLAGNTHYRIAHNDTITLCSTNTGMQSSYTDNRPRVYFEYTPASGIHFFPTNGANLGTVDLSVYSSDVGTIEIRGGNSINVPQNFSTVIDLSAIAGVNSYSGTTLVNGSPFNNTASFTPRNPSIVLSDSSNLGNINVAVTNYNAPYKLYRNGVLFATYLASQTNVEIPATGTEEQSLSIVATSNAGIDFTSGASTITPRGPDFSLVDKNGFNLIASIFNGKNVIIERSSDGTTFQPITTEMSGNIYIDKTVNIGNLYYYRISAESSLSGRRFTSNIKSLTVKSHFAKWMSFIDGAGSETGRKVAVDLNENVYIVGHTTSTVITLNNGVNYRRPAAIQQTAEVGFLAKFNSSGIAQWLVYLGVALGQTGSASYIFGVDTDFQNNVYITGDIQNNLVIGDGITSAVTLTRFSTNTRIFVIKLNGTNDSIQMSSRILWSAWIHGFATTSSLNNLIVDNENNVLIAGTITTPASTIRVSNTDYPLALPLATPRNQSNTAAFVAKLNGSNGNAIWYQRIDGSSADNALNIAVDSLGNAVVVGYISGSISTIAVATTEYPIILPTTATQTAVAGFVAKLNKTNGTVLWFQRVDANATDYTYGVTCDPSNNIIIVGYLQVATAGFINIANLQYNLPLSTTGVAQLSSVAFIAKLNESNGNAMWFQRIDAASTDYGYEIVSDSKGDVYICGYLSESTSGFITVADASYNLLLPQTGANHVNSAAFIAKLRGTTGSAIWFERIDTAGQDVGYSITNDNADNIYLTGVITPSIPLATIITENGTSFVKPSSLSAAFVIKYENLIKKRSILEIKDGNLGEIIITPSYVDTKYTLYKTSATVNGYIDISFSSFNYILDTYNPQSFYIVSKSLMEPFNDISSYPVIFTPRTPSFSLNSNVGTGVEILPTIYNGTIVSIERSLDNISFSTITPSFIKNKYVDATVSLYTTYYYRISVAAFNNSSNIFNVPAKQIMYNDYVIPSALSFKVNISNNNFILSDNNNTRISIAPSLEQLYHTTYTYLLNYTPTADTLLRFYNGATELTLGNTPTKMIQYLDANNNIILDPVTNVGSIKSIHFNNKIVYNTNSTVFTSATNTTAPFMSTIQYKANSVSGGQITYETIPRYEFSGDTTTYDGEMFAMSISGENGTFINFNSLSIPSHKTGEYRTTFGLKDALHSYIELSPGQTYTMNLLLGVMGGAPYSYSQSIFIDYNGDGDFNEVDLGEFAAASSFSISVPIVDGVNRSFTFTIPNNVVPGKLGRIRVVNIESNIYTTSNLPFSFGSTYDFSIRIKPSGPVEAIPVVAASNAADLGKINLSISGFNEQYTLFINESALPEYTNIFATSLTLPVEDSSLQSYYITTPSIIDPSNNITSSTATITPRKPSISIANGSNLGDVVLSVTNYNAIYNIYRTNVLLTGIYENITSSSVTLPVDSSGVNEFYVIAQAVGNPLLTFVSSTVSITPRAPAISLNNGANLGDVVISITNYNATYNLYKNENLYTTSTSSSITVPVDNNNLQTFYITASAVNNSSVVFGPISASITPRSPSITAIANGANFGDVVLTITNYNGLYTIVRNGQRLLAPYADISSTTITVPADNSGSNSFSLSAKAVNNADAVFPSNSMSITPILPLITAINHGVNLGDITLNITNYSASYNLYRNNALYGTNNASTITVPVDNSGVNSFFVDVIAVNNPKFIYRTNTLSITPRSPIISVSASSNDGGITITVTRYNSSYALYKNNILLQGYENTSNNTITLTGFDTSDLQSFYVIANSVSNSSVLLKSNVATVNPLIPDTLGSAIFTKQVGTNAYINIDTNSYFLDFRKDSLSNKKLYLDSASNLYAIGAYTGVISDATLTSGNGSMVSNPSTISSYLMKMDAEGNVIFAKTINNTQGATYLHQIDVVETGEYAGVYVCGRYVSNVNSAFTNIQLKKPGGATLKLFGFIAKYTLAGEFEWSETLENTYATSTIGSPITCISVSNQGIFFGAMITGNVYLTKTTNGTVHTSIPFIGAGFYGRNPSSTSYDIAIYGLDVSGMLLPVINDMFIKTISTTTGDNFIRDIKAADDGLYVAYDLFEVPSGTTMLNAYVNKYEYGTGAQASGWPKILGSDYNDYANSIAITNNSVYVGGSQSVWEGASTEVSSDIVGVLGATSNWFGSAYLISRNKDASLKWIRRIDVTTSSNNSTSEDEFIHSIAATETAVYVTGEITGYNTAHNLTETFYDVSAGTIISRNLLVSLPSTRDESVGFILKYRPNGDFVWAKLVNTVGSYDMLYSIYSKNSIVALYRSQSNNNVISYNLDSGEMTPVFISEPTEPVKIFLNPFNSFAGKTVSVSATGGTGIYVYSWEGSGINNGNVIPNNESAFIRFRDDIETEDITVRVISNGSSAIKTFTIEYIKPAVITSFAPTETLPIVVPEDELRITEDDKGDIRVVVNVNTGLDVFIGENATVTQYVPPPNLEIATLSAKLIEEIRPSGHILIEFDIDKYKGDGTKVESIINETSTYGTINFDISEGVIFAVAWKNVSGLQNMAMYNPNVIPNIVEYNNTTLQFIRNDEGRNYFQYFGPNSQTVIVVNPAGTNAIPCFAKGTCILTPEGQKLVEILKTGDIILTADGRKVPATIYSTYIPKTTTKTAPYLIPARSFGSAPTSDLILSSKHAVQSKKGVWQIPEFCTKARQLPAGQEVSYYHIELPNYFTDNLVANGMIAESLANKQVDRTKTLYTYNKKLAGFIRNSPGTTSKSAPKH
jgi:hypothetical protein